MNVNNFKLEDPYLRKERLDVISQKYSNLAINKKGRMIELGEKPICLASFFIYDIII